MAQIYFDHAATTPLAAEVLEAMRPFFSEKFGNASSIHFYGREAKVVVESARDVIARLVGAEPGEIVFTAGGSESNNTAIKGVAFSRKDKGNHIIVSSVDHESIIKPAEFLTKQGLTVTYLPVNSFGQAEMDELKKAVTAQTILISVMHANNEIGTINNIGEIGKFCREKNILFHTDAVQTFGKIPIRVKEMNIDLLSLSAHKIYGPKGVGALYIRKGIQLESFVHGGSQERNRRGGTENVPGIVGLGRAAELMEKSFAEENIRLAKLRDRLRKGIEDKIPDVIFHGHPENRLANNLSVSFAGVEGDSLLLSLDLKGISASSGSACASGSQKPSHVLKALGLSPELIRSVVRFSLGRTNTETDIDYVLEVLPEIITRLRKK